MKEKSGWKKKNLLFLLAKKTLPKKISKKCMMGGGRISLIVL